MHRTRDAKYRGVHNLCILKTSDIDSSNGGVNDDVIFDKIISTERAGFFYARPEDKTIGGVKRDISEKLVVDRRAQSLNVIGVYAASFHDIILKQIIGSRINNEGGIPAGRRKLIIPPRNI